MSIARTTPAQKLRGAATRTRFTAPPLRARRRHARAPRTRGGRSARSSARDVARARARGRRRARSAPRRDAPRRPAGRPALAAGPRPAARSPEAAAGHRGRRGRRARPPGGPLAPPLAGRTRARARRWRLAQRPSEAPRRLLDARRGRDGRRRLEARVDAAVLAAVVVAGAV